MFSPMTDFEVLDPLASAQKLQAQSVLVQPQKSKSRIAPLVVFFLFWVGISALGFMFLSNRHAFILSALLGGVGSVLAVPLEYALFVFFFYLLFDGFIKLYSGYNPIAHVGQDIVLLIIFWRSLTDSKSGGVSKISKTPYIRVIVIFSIWVLIQFINPFGLGLLPSIAGSKIYFSGLAIYFIAYHHLNEKVRRQLLVWILGLAAFEGVLAVVEYLYFPNLIYDLGSGEGAITFKTIAKGDAFTGLLYRPVGTTAVPGGPAVWMYIVAPVAMYFLFQSGEKIWARVLSLVFFGFALFTLFFSQVRLGVVLLFLSVFFVAFYPRGHWIRRASVTMLGVVTLVGIAVYYVNKTLSQFDAGNDALTVQSLMANPEAQSGLMSADKLLNLKERTMTLGDKETYLTARGGALSAALDLASTLPFGIGLSRVAAASSPWLDRIRKDAYFGERWAFADNLFRALFTELGIFGMLMWLAMISIFIFKLFKKSLKVLDFKKGFLLWICGVGPAVFLVGGFASEGVLYSPVAPMWWLLFGIGMRESDV